MSRGGSWRVIFINMFVRRCFVLVVKRSPLQHCSMARDREVVAGEMARPFVSQQVVGFFIIDTEKAAGYKYPRLRTVLKTSILLKVSIQIHRPHILRFKNECLDQYPAFASSPCVHSQNFFPPASSPAHLLFCNFPTGV